MTRLKTLGQKRPQDDRDSRNDRFRAIDVPSSPDKGLDSAQVALSQRDRRRVGVDPVQVPAALVTWIAKDTRADIDGKTLLLHAVATARRAAELLATSVLVVDPFDEETAAMWRERYGFRVSAEAREPKRLWLALNAID